jgi:hypothetical protein
MRDLTEEEKRELPSSAAHYVRIAAVYREKNGKGR